MSSVRTLLDIMAALRHPETGCPWDLEQTYATVAPYTIEEAYEVADAIHRGDLTALQGELGDLLFQVVFYSRMAEEEGVFAFADVVTAICDKMRRRHPHVFGSEEQRAAGAQAGSWERIKADERSADSPGTDAGALEGLALSLPALKKAAKLGQRAARVGFDWPDVTGVRAKVDEELGELDEAHRDGDRAAMTEELGDLLFSVANLARHLEVDPEEALEAANRKFRRRFEGVEQAVRDSGQRLEDLDIDALERYWQRQKDA